MKTEFILTTSAGDIHMNMEERLGQKYLNVNKDDFSKLGIIMQDLIGMGYGYRIIEINNITPSVSGYTKDELVSALGITSDDLDLIINGKCNLRIKGYGYIYNVSAEVKNNLFANVCSYITSQMDWDYNKLIVNSVDFLKTSDEIYYMIRQQDVKFIPEQDNQQS